ncbi:MAG: hypothetical protein AB7O21_06565 [Gammaproteobacteria bacterium]
MTRRLTRWIALAAPVAAATAAHAHENLALDGPLHRALHVIGTERLVVLGGTVLACAVGWIVRREVRRLRIGRTRDEA